jgi:hypothetical protein
MKTIHVAFADKDLESSYERLLRGDGKEWELHKEIAETILWLKNGNKGIRIQKRLWPHEYIKKFAITNLWKINLRHGWRMIYTLASDETMILAIILDYWSHKDYEKKFKYLCSFLHKRSLRALCEA